ncbi:MAG: zinc-dependent peptidase [Verrucomicrobiales bacterium]
MQAITLYAGALLLLVVGGWIFDRWQRRRRGMRVRAVGFPLRWVPLVERGLPLYQSLPHDLREALQAKAFFKINDLHITGPGGLDEVTDAMRVSLGGHIGLLQAQLRIAPVPALRQVVVGTGPAMAAASQTADSPWGDGTLLAEWDPAAGAGRCFREERDPSIMDQWRRLGAGSREDDPLPDDHLYFAGWAGPLWHDLPECQRAALALAPELGTEPGLFAAATEAFLRRPGSLQAVEPHLFAALKHFYRYDPSRWARRPSDETAGQNPRRVPVNPAAPTPA